MSVNIKRNGKKRIVIVGGGFGGLGLQRSFAIQTCRWFWWIRTTIISFRR